MKRTGTCQLCGLTIREDDDVEYAGAEVCHVACVEVSHADPGASQRYRDELDAANQVLDIQ